MKYNKVLLVNFELGVRLHTRFNLYKGDMLFCSEDENFPYIVKEILYRCNNKEYTMTPNMTPNINSPISIPITNLYDGDDRLPIQILIRDGLLEDITRDYKLKIILEQ